MRLNDDTSSVPVAVMLGAVTGSIDVHINHFYIPGIMTSSIFDFLRT